MSSNRTAVVVALALCLPAAPVHAGTPALVDDLNPGLAYSDSPQPEELTAFRGQAVFTVLETGRGRTLWASDGTPDGTRRLAEGLDAVTAVLGEAGAGLVVLAARDFQQPRTGLWRVDLDGRAESLLPLGVSALGRTFFPFEGAYYFFATPAPGRSKYYYPPAATSLWRTDGTAAGTREVAPVGASHFTVGPVVFKGRLFFLVAERGEYEPEVYLRLWASNGRFAGTEKLAELESASLEVFLLATARRLVFPAETRHGEELWASDGTVAGTLPITSFAAEAPFSSGYARATVAAGRLYFLVDDGEHGRELWASDGTRRGSARLTDFAGEDPFALDESGSATLAAAGPGVLFAADDGAHGLEVWRSAGSAGTTALVADACPGVCSGFVWPGPVQDGRLYFAGHRPETGAEPWMSDGTAVGTRGLADLCPGACDASVGFTTVGGRITILDFEQGTSFALYATDGSPAGTDLLLEADLALMSTSPRPFAKLGRRLVFFASSAESPAELWTATVPRGVAAPVTDLTQSQPAGSDPIDLTAAGGKVFFAGCDGSRATLFVTTGEGAAPLLDLGNDCPNFGDPNTDDRLLTGVGGRAYLANLDVWVSDGTPDGTVNLTHFDWRPTGYPTVVSNVADLGGLAAFLTVESAEAGLYNERLWLSDGTPEGTHATDALPQPLTVLELFSIRGRLYFWGRDAQGVGLWSSDGTAGGTHLLYRLPAYAEPPEQAPIEALGAVYFTVRTPQFSLGLWRTDGTPGGTEEIRGLVPEPVLGPPAESLGTLGGTAGGALFFVAGTGSEGTRELWRTDGTPSGTARLGPVGASTAEYLGGGVEAGGKVFYLTTNFETTRLWATDGTPAGTGLLGPPLGMVAISPIELVAAGEKVFFPVFDPEHGGELWQSDGTEAGTRLAADIAPGRFGFEPPRGLIATGPDLYFSADDGTFGREPWRLPVTSGAGGCDPSPFALCLAGGRLQATLAWRDAGGVPHRAPARSLASQSGASQSGGFSFTEPASLELVVKGLDATGVNGHLWAFAGPLTDAAWELTWRDGATGGARRWINLLHQRAAFADLEAFPTQSPPAATSAIQVLAEGASLLAGRALPGLEVDLYSAPVCTPAPGVACLHGGRFRVEVSRAGSPLGATALPWSDLAGAFALAPGANADLAVKVLDATALDGHYWVFGTSLTHRAYTVTVTDTVTGTQKSYDKPEGQLTGFADLGSF